MCAQSNPDPILVDIVQTNVKEKHFSQAGVMLAKEQVSQALECGGFQERQLLWL